MTVIILPRAHVEAVVQKRPGSSRIIGAINSAIGLGFDGGPHAIWIHWRYRDSDFSFVTFGQPGFQLRPGISAIGRLINSAARPDAGDVPRSAQHLPGGGVERPRIVRV